MAAIGPSICQDCYEVSEDVILEFQKNFRKEDWDDLYYRKENGKYQLNLWRANEIIFQEAGVKKEHIAVTKRMHPLQSGKFCFHTGLPGIKEEI